MQIFFYITIGIFVLDIIVGIVSGIIEGKRAAKFDKRLWWLEQQLDKDIFSEFNGGNDKAGKRK